MRIAHVTRQFAPAIGGLEEAVLKLTEELRRRHRLDIEIVTLDRVFSEPSTTLPATDRVDDIDVTRIPFSGSRRYPFAPSVLRAIDRCDLVHVHGIDFFFDYLAFTAPLHRKPLVATTHGGFFHTRFAAHLKQAFFHTVTRVSCLAYREIFATSENDGALFRAVAGDKVTVVENGVDVAKWSDRASVVKTRNLIYFGRLSANKRVELLMPMLRYLRDDGDDWTLTVAGRADDVSFEALRKAACAASVEGAVTFAPAPSSQEIGQLIEKASYYISASEHEGFGISAVEAMSAGLVPVLSRIPAFERFAEMAPAVLIDPTGSAEAAESLRTFHRQHRDNAADRRRLISAASQFDWAAIANVVAESYARNLSGISRV